MAVKLRNVRATNAAGHGISYLGNDLDADGVTVENVGGDAIHIISPPAAMYIQTPDGVIGVEADKAGELAMLLAELIALAPQERPAYVERSQWLREHVAAVADLTTISTWLVSLAGNPAAHELVKRLLGA